VTTQTDQGLRPAEGDGLFASEPPQGSRWRVNTHKVVSYEVSLSRGLLDPDNSTLALAGASGEPGRPRRLAVLDARVHELYGEQVSAYFTAQGVGHEFCVIDADEGTKSMESVFRIVSAMNGFGVLRRREPVIAIGGGVLTDLVGLASSLYRRSTPYVRVPTTLIGMVDAGIGAKTGVNFLQHKNRLGSYHPAAMTLVDPGFLATLSRRHLRNGLAEVLKIALIKDAGLFELLAEHGARLVAERMQAADSGDDGAVATEVIRRSIHGMLQELQPNLWEHDLRRVVDYGHSFSPTIEMEVLPELLHGEAVSIDMALSAVLACRRGLLTRRDLDRILAVMDRLGLPARHPVCTSDLLAKALEDTVKHRDGRQLLPLTEGIGAARFVDDVSYGELEEALAMLDGLGAEAEARAPAG
jgi:2-epi-5-epi-valiolone synthase